MVTSHTGSLLLIMSLLFGRALASGYRPLPKHMLHELAAPLPDHEKSRLRESVALVMETFAPMAAAQGSKITTVFHWESSGAGAFTFRKDGGRVWEVHFYDGLLRFPFASDDLIMSVACHELGHPLGGYPFKDNNWSSAEGQADYFSLHTCLPEVWKSQPELNSRLGAKAPQELKRRCEETFAPGPRRDICFRSAHLMESIRLYEGNGRAPFPNFDTPDPNVVRQTDLSHPKPQCRLDTQIAAMLCGKMSDPFHIPGYFEKGENTPEAELDSSNYICMRSLGELIASRPRCWFAALTE